MTDFRDELDKTEAERNRLIQQLNAANTRAEAAITRNAALRAQLDAATKLNTDLLNDIIRLTGRVNALEEAASMRPVTEPPTERIEEYIILGEIDGKLFTCSALWDGDDWLELNTELPVGHHVRGWQPLPAPPQE